MTEKTPGGKFSKKEPQTSSLRGGLTFGTTMDPYRKVMTKAKKRGKARVFGQDLMKGENPKFPQTASLKGGLTFGQTMHPYDGTDPQTPASGVGTSIFDPVLCELLYRWFCPPKGIVLDPFAGGSVRGIVASKLGRSYVGIDLREEQVRANEQQAARICGRPKPQWIVGDARQVGTLCRKVSADFICSCPPYADLEVYSDDEFDLSTLNYAEFRRDYAMIIKATTKLLKKDRFACFVVGDLRDSRGMYHGFPWHTVQAFQDAGLELYNEMVLVTAIGSLPIRIGKQFQLTRKCGKTHQNVLVFVKGDPRKATEAIGEVEVGEIEAAKDGPAE